MANIDHVHILVVEDSPTQAVQIQYLLEKNDYEVTVAQDGQQALEMLEEITPTIIISDIVMPKMNGYQLCNAIKENDRLKDIPVILLTSLSDPEDVINGLICGANNFIVKPYDENFLLSRIKYILANKEIRKTASSQMGIEIVFRGKRYFLTSERVQMIDLLLSTYEAAIQRNLDFQVANEKLQQARDELETRVDERTAELVDANVNLQKEIEERKRIQEEREKLFDDLGIRVKEMTCLYGVSRLISASTGEVAGVFREAVTLIPPGWCYPGITCTRITFEAQVFTSDNFRETPWKLSADIVIQGEKLGLVEVFYLEERPQLDEGPFLKEERDLIDELARQLGGMVEHHRSEATLRESEERHRILFESSRDAIMTLEPPSWRFTSGNRATVQMFAAKTAVEFISRGVEELSPELQPDGRPSLEKSREMIETAVREGSHFFEWTHSRLNGEDFPATVQLTKMESGGKAFLQATVRDITASKRAEEEREKLQAQFLQAQKMESVGRLAGGVAHDFNNMLQTILGHSEMALEGIPEDSPIREDLQEIQKASQRSADLTRQLLAFARKQTIAPKMLDLNETVGGMLKMLTRLIGEDIDLLWLPSKDIWSLMIDPSQVDQILANLCVNARDAIGGTGKVTIETENVSLDEAYCASHLGFSPGQYVVLTVSDDGCGMDKEVLSHLFEPFFTTKRAGEGTGLGLATVYGIVQQNGGYINVYSEPGQGTTFKIYLPRFEGKASAILDEPEEKTPTSHGETVLLVEDEESILKLGKKMLERLGYVVLTASAPAEALRRVEEHGGEIHLLITDVIMPEMDGRELSERMIEIKPALKCLFMSGYTANAIAHRGVLDEGVQFIEKPFSLQNLAVKVRRALDQ